METLKQVLIRRDGLTEQQADEQITEAREAIFAGEDPEVVLEDYFGLEPDYLFDLI